MPRGLFRAAVGVAVAAVVGGSVLAYVGTRTSSGPADVVRGYFAALARADAPAALAYGDLPPGSRRLLTTPVLRTQQRLAPIGRVSVGAAIRHGDRARVGYSYRLGFPGGEQRVRGRVVLRRDGSSWRLTRVAVPVRLRLDQAAARATLAGARIPDRTALLFPGAVPLRFDTPYLRLGQSTDDVVLGTSGTVELNVQVSPAGRRAVARALAARLRRCVDQRSAGDPTCPVASARDVPGSLRGTVRTPIMRAVHLAVTDDRAGVIAVSGHVDVTGRYRRLAFDDVAERRRGTARLPVRASAYAVRPLTLTFAR